MRKEYYPIGTIVELEKIPERLFMIVGLAVENEAGEYRDYVAVRYPIGMLDNQNYYFFYHRQVGRIVHMGYVNTDHETYVDLINAMIDKKSSKKGI